MPEEKPFEFDFDEDSKVNPNKLHEECFSYGHQAWKYGEALSHAIYVRDKAKDRLEICHEDLKEVKARLTLEALKDPKAIGLGEKPTVAAVEAWCLTHEKWSEARDTVNKASAELTEANHQVNLIKAGVDSIQYAKSTGLEMAVKLYTGEYWSTEGTPKDVPQDWQNWKAGKRDEAAAKQRERMKRGK